MKTLNLNSLLAQEGTYNNFRRMGCYIILTAYMDLKRWIKPLDRYSPEQIETLIEEGDPTVEIEEFFFGPDGVEEVIKAFDLSLDAADVRALTKNLIKEARHHVNDALASDLMASGHVFSQN